MSFVPIRCFTCGKVINNRYEEYEKKCAQGIDYNIVLDELKFFRPCCRRMFMCHVDIEKYLLMYPTYENGVQYLGNEFEYKINSDIATKKVIVIDEVDEDD